MGTADGLPGPTDAWITLAGLARETRRIRLGTLMTAGTFRLPGVLAIQVAQVDQMSGGRVELGLGAGWYEEEHTAYGIPFPEEKIGPAGGAAGDRHRTVVHAGRRDLRLRRHLLPAHRLARAAQAHAGQDPGAGRRPRHAAHPASGGPVRRRVQHAVRVGRGHRAAVRAGQRCRRGGRPQAGRPGVLQRADRLRRQGRRRGRPPCRGDRPRRGGAAGQRAGRHPRRGGRQDRQLRRGRAPPASTCRSSTWTTSTTWS